MSRRLVPPSPPAEAYPPDVLRAPTQDDVARRSGVSTATVSRVLNNPDCVRPEVRQRVEEVIAELGYFPHGAARALASNRSRTIGAVFPTVDNEIFASAINALTQEVSQARYTLVLSISNYDLDAETIQVRRLVERGIDGLVLVGNDHSAGTYSLIDQAHLPYVSLLSYNGPGGRPSIGILNREAGHAATRHLLDLGHSRIGMICGITAGNDRARERYHGYIEAMGEAGLKPRRDGVAERPYSIQAAREALGAMIESGHMPTALVCGNDVLALGALLEAQARGLSVPDDLSIVGFDDLPFSRHFSPALTTVAVPVGEASRRAGAELIAAISSSRAVESHRLEAPLLVRGSTAPPRRDAFEAPPRHSRPKAKAGQVAAMAGTAAIDAHNA